MVYICNVRLVLCLTIIKISNVFFEVKHKTYTNVESKENDNMTNEDMKSMDPVMLLSFINTKLRDEYSSLNSLCNDLSLDEEFLKNKLHNIGYEYNIDMNQFK